MTLSIDDLAAELDASQLWALLFALADAAGLPVTAMQSTEAPRSLITTFSAWAASVYNGPIRSAMRAQYGDMVVETSRTWATFWGLSFFGVAPDDATFAEGPVKLTNTKGGSWSFAPGTYLVKNSLLDKQFVNTETVTLAAWPGSGSYPTQTVNFRAIEPGSGSTSTAGTIDTTVTASNGVTVTNTSSIVGLDEESLTDFVVRARQTPALISPNGPKAAYEVVLRRTLRSDGSRIACNRVRVRAPTGNGTVRSVVAGPSGALPVADVNRMLLNLRTLAEPWGITAQVVSATNVLVNYNITAYAKQSPTLDGAVIISAGTSAIQSFVNSASIGGWNKLGGDSGFVYHDRKSSGS
jgi:Baseplate J-like protein